MNFINYCNAHWDCTVKALQEEKEEEERNRLREIKLKQEEEKIKNESQRTTIINNISINNIEAVYYNDGNQIRKLIIPIIVY